MMGNDLLSRIILSFSPVTQFQPGKYYNDQTPQASKGRQNILQAAG